MSLKCVLCGDEVDDNQCMVIAIDGTEEDGTELGAVAHMQCMNLRLNKEHNIIYQRTK